MIKFGADRLNKVFDLARELQDTGDQDYQQIGNALIYLVQAACHGYIQDVAAVVSDYVKEAEKQAAEKRIVSSNG